MKPANHASGEHAVVHADGYRSAGQIYLIPVSAADGEAHIYSLIRLIEAGEGEAESPCAELHHLLDAGRRFSGCFLITPAGFCSEGSLTATLTEIRHVEIRPLDPRGANRSRRLPKMNGLARALGHIAMRRLPKRGSGSIRDADDL